MSAEGPTTPLTYHQGIVLELIVCQDWKSMIQSVIITVQKTSMILLNDAQSSREQELYVHRR